MENAFYFTLKALFLLFAYVDKRLNQKNEVNFKTYDVRTWETNKCNHILRNVSKRKDNQTNKFDQSITWETLFFGRSYANFGGETFSRPLF